MLRAWPIKCTRTRRYCSISAFDRGDDYDEYGVCIAYVFEHPEGSKLTSNGREFESGTIIRASTDNPTCAHSLCR